MNRLYNELYDGGIVPLSIEDDISAKRNIYTVVVGKNGVGKSRLLSQITKKCIINQDEYLYVKNHNFYRAFPKVIAVSTSPFDKFPTIRRTNYTQKLESNYRYVGMRGDGPYIVSNVVSLLSSASNGWLEKLANSENPTNLLDVFHSLNFEPFIDFIFKPTYMGIQRELIEVDSVQHEVCSEINNLNMKYGISIEHRYVKIIDTYNYDTRQEIYDAMIQINKYLSSRKAINLSVDFIKSELFFGGSFTSSTFIKLVLKLFNLGFIRLMDIRMIKNDFGPMSLKRASSGEQCLLIMMLGIAGHISDNSLILIDEPEISLHPRWQEEFMIMLTKSFSSYEGCQFIIATHSPQIISRLPSQGCYITSLSNNEIYRSDTFSERSADYQLAELFDAPGIMNEYIARLSFSLLSKVKLAKSVSDINKEELDYIENLAKNIDFNDPIKVLVESVKQVCDLYA
ncbi:AAA family ATPase [Rosenbergiella epipactidis]|uniref:AAA family ATPase n=1 Tax=Rosenbergiella epipactidis TaxID=1544694 RepID=UPI001F4D5828|nr:AAA family ATPase [Rosenbergiella epipactidis]